MSDYPEKAVEAVAKAVWCYGRKRPWNHEEDNPQAMTQKGLAEAAIAAFYEAMWLRWEERKARVPESHKTLEDGTKERRLVSDWQPVEDDD